MFLSFISKSLKSGQWLKIKVMTWNAVDSEEMCSGVIICVKKERLFFKLIKDLHFSLFY